MVYCRSSSDQIRGSSISPGATPAHVRGDVAGVIARCLHGVNADLGKIRQGIRQFGELDPVELDILPGGEVAVAAVVAPRHMRQPPQLLRRQRAVGNRDAEHIGVQLQIDAVLQPQHLEFVFGEFAGQPALHLVAKFLDALVDNGAVEFVICVHGKNLMPEPEGRW